MYTIFHNGLVYSNAELKFIHTDVLVRGGVIVDADFSDSPESLGENVKVVDCTDKYILPGLVDVHTHGRSGFDFNSAPEKSYADIRKSYAKVGTTTIMATLGSAPYKSLISSIDAINKNRKPTCGLATIAGTHLEGRYLNHDRRGAHNTNYLHEFDCKEQKELIDRMNPAPIHISAAYELPGGNEFLDDAVKMGVTCGLAHSNATYAEAMKAVRHGVTSFTHTFNAMRPVHHREPGNTTAALTTDSVYAELICDGEHIHPAIISLAARLKPLDKLVLITDSMEAAGMLDGEYSIAGLKVTVKNGRAINSEGALAGSTVDLFTAMCNFMKFTDTTLEKAIPCATSNPAAMVGISDVCGAIQNGLRADFIMINDKKSPAIESVWICGEKI